MIQLRSRLRFLLDRALTSYFVIPAVAGFLGVSLALGTLYLDFRGLPFHLPLPIEQMDDARSLVTTIATTSISVAATVFSITIVVLSLASSQFGPRLLRNFLKHRASQAVLGLYVGTHTFCLVALRTVGGGWEVPQLTCFVALVLALIGAGALVFFIHHTATWIQADRLIDVVADTLDDELQKLTRQRPVFHDAERWVPRLGEPTLLVRTPRAGYVQTHDDDRLRALAEKYDLTIERAVEAGDYVFEGHPVARVWGSAAAECIEGIRATFALDDARSDLQDPFHLVDQLIELALRALSPGVNDPITAVSCVDRLANALMPVIAQGIPEAEPLDASARPRLIARAPDLAELCGRAFGEIRRAGSDQRLVTRRLRSVLPVLIEGAHDERVRGVLRIEREALADH